MKLYAVIHSAQAQLCVFFLILLVSKHWLHAFVFAVSSYDHQTSETGQPPPPLTPIKDETTYLSHHQTLQQALAATQRHLEDVANKIWW